MKYRRSLKQLTIISAAGFAALTALPAKSHHSFAMYDQRATRALTGRLVRFIPGANHAQLIFEVLDESGAVVTDDKGEPVLWGVETGPAARLAEHGVTIKAFPVGTVISVVVNPLRDGRNFGALARENGQIVRCGTTVPEGGCNAETGDVFATD
jgi:hypothetical protein